MRSLFLLATLVVLFAGRVLAQEEGPLGVYLPTTESSQAYFGMRQFLVDWENNPAKVDDPYFAQIFQHQAGHPTIEGLLFENFLRQTRNTAIRDQVARYLKGTDAEPDLAKSLSLHYRTTPQPYVRDGKSYVRYTADNQWFDEGIDYFHFAEVKLLHDEMGMLLPTNDWAVITIKNKTDGSVDPDSFFLLVGGGTNSMSVYVKRARNIEPDQVMENLEEKYFVGKYNRKPFVYDLPLEGEIARSGADRFLLEYDFGKDLFPEIEGGDFSAFLYKQSTKTLYRVNYFINFSQKNIDFSQRMRIYQYLLLNLTYVFLNEDPGRDG